MQNQLLNVLKDQNEVTGHRDMRLLEAESLAVEALNKCFLTMSLFNVSTTHNSAGVGDLQQTYVCVLVQSPPTICQLHELAIDSANSVRRSKAG
jgi:hypothetical protein